MSSHYYSDDDLDFEGDEIRKEYEKIKHFTLDDYLDCTSTYKIIYDEWNKRVEDTLESKIISIYEKYYGNFHGVPCMKIRKGMESGISR